MQLTSLWVWHLQNLHVVYIVWVWKLMLYIYVSCTLIISYQFVQACVISYQIPKISPWEKYRICAQNRKIDTLKKVEKNVFLVLCTKCSSSLQKSFSEFTYTYFLIIGKKGTLRVWLDTNISLILNSSIIVFACIPDFEHHNL